jgi:outer membrane protein assembly factor BamB
MRSSIFYRKPVLRFRNQMSLINKSILRVWIAVIITVSAPAFAQESESTQGVENATDWSSFRNGGNSAISDDGEFPSSWSATEGISWQIELPGYGQSAPLIVGNKVIVAAVDGPQKNNNLVACLHRETGEELWRIRQPSSLQGPSNFMFSRAAPTPVADKNRVIAFFESGDLLAVQLTDGHKLWERDLKKEIGDLKTRHGLGSSLAQTDDLFYINLEHDGPSALLAIQKSDGETKWKTERPSGSSWSSPVIMRRGDQNQVVVSSAGEAAGYDAETGMELWKIGGLAGNSVPSPLVTGNRIYLGARKPEFGSVAAAAKSNLCLEFREGEQSPTIAWRSERCIADYCSPVVSGDFLFLINGSGILGCLDKKPERNITENGLDLSAGQLPLFEATNCLCLERTERRR